MIIAASTHNAKDPFPVWLKDIVSLGFRYIDVEYLKVPDAPRGLRDIVKLTELKGIEPEDVATIKEFRSRKFLEVVGIEAGALAMESPDSLAKTERRVREVVDLASNLGADIVSFTPSVFNHGKVSFAALTEACSRLCHHAEHKAVKLALENGEQGSKKLLRTPEQILSVIAQVGSPNLGVCLDVAAAATQDFNVAQFASKLAEHTFIVHINDVTRDLRFKNLIVGLGDLELAPLFNMFKGRKIPFVIEIFSGYGAIDVFLCKRQIERVASLN